MQMKTFHFLVDCRCWSNESDDGERESRMVNNLEIQVEDWDQANARDRIREVAYYEIDEAGSRLLDWPLDEVEIVRAKFLHTSPAVYG